MTDRVMDLGTGRRKTRDNPFVYQNDYQGDPYTPGPNNPEPGPDSPPPNDANPDDKKPKRPSTGGGGGGAETNPYSWGNLESALLESMYGRLKNPQGLWSNELERQNYYGTVQDTVANQFRGAGQKLGEQLSMTGLATGGAAAQGYTDIAMGRAGAAATGIQQATIKNQEMRIADLNNVTNQILGYAGIQATKYAADKAAAAQVASANIAADTQMYHYTTERVTEYYDRGITR